MVSKSLLISLLIGCVCISVGCFGFSSTIPEFNTLKIVLVTTGLASCIGGSIVCFFLYYTNTRPEEYEVIRV